jgi:hypothetical protein
MSCQEITVLAIHVYTLIFNLKKSPVASQDKVICMSIGNKERNIHVCINYICMLILVIICTLALILTIVYICLIGNLSDKCLPTWTLLWVSFRHIFISLPSFMGMLNSEYKTSHLNHMLSSGL